MAWAKGGLRELDRMGITPGDTRQERVPNDIREANEAILTFLQPLGRLRNTRTPPRGRKTEEESSLSIGETLYSKVAVLSKRMLC